MPSPSGSFIVFDLRRVVTLLPLYSYFCFIVIVFPLLWLSGSKASFIPFFGLLGGIHRLPLV